LLRHFDHQTKNCPLLIAPQVMRVNMLNWVLAALVPLGQNLLPLHSLKFL
jgi:hypothetical protein